MPTSTPAPTHALTPAPVPIRVVWLINARFEREWLWTLLTEVGPIEEIEEAGDDLHPPNSIFIINKSFEYEPYFAQYEAAGIPYAVIHTSDEYYNDSYKFYDHAMCSWIARNYWHPLLSKRQNVITFGLGWKNGFASAAAPPPPENFADRPYVVSFAGNIHHAFRYNFVKTFASIEPNKFHLTQDGFDSVNGLDIVSYRALMNQSKYVLCPIGHCNIDSFRVYEALEAGAIPITISITSMQKWLYWEALFGAQVPWIATPTIEDAYSELQKRLSHDNGGADVKAFWDNSKKKWVEQFRQMITSAK